MPSSVLRAYRASTDKIYIPVLLKSKYTGCVTLSNQLFLLHPFVVSVLVAAISANVYLWISFFDTHLLLPGETLSEDEAGWEDSFAKGIYAVPPIAFIIGIAFALAHWYHARLWARVAERQSRKADVVDIPYYYARTSGEQTKSASSKFWCLEYENQIVAAWGVDGRNPAKSIQLIDKERIPEPTPEELANTQSFDVNAKPAEKEKPYVPKPLKPFEEDDDDLEQDLALFQNYTKPPRKAKKLKQSEDVDGTAEDAEADANAEPEEVPEPILNEADFAPAGSTSIPTSKLSLVKDSKFVEIRHLTLSDTYKPTKGVEGHILALAVQSAFTQEQVQQVLIRLDPKLDKAFRTHALSGGFRIIRNDVQLERGADPASWKDSLETFISVLWPLGFEQELLVLDRRDWAMPGQ